jgi:hypothetical protein
LGIFGMKTYWPGAALALVLVSAASTALAQESVPMPPPIAAPQDVAYPGTITLDVDATDRMRGIWRAREVIPVRSGPMTLLYAEWIPGKHSPRGPINLFAGLEIRANGQLIPWRRDPVNVYAFHIDVPAGVSEIVATHQYVSPTASNQGRIVSTREMITSTGRRFCSTLPATTRGKSISARA